MATMAFNSSRVGEFAGYVRTMAETMLVAALNPYGRSATYPAGPEIGTPSVIAWSGQPRGDRPANGSAKKQINRMVHSAVAGLVIIGLVAGFSKPMRWRENGVVAPVPRGNPRDRPGRPFWLENR